MYINYISGTELVQKSFLEWNSECNRQWHGIHDTITGEREEFENSYKAHIYNEKQGKSIILWFHISPSGKGHLNPLNRH